MSDNNDKDVLDSNYPLMLRLREACPGTFSHSKNVADILETIGTELGLDSRKLKIAGYYHDIGKIFCAKAFSENQGETDNVHDALEPWVSYNLITAHVANTIQILYNEPEIEPEIVEWCSQHHGTTVVLYFFMKSKSEDADAYRYRTKAPQSLEAALLMLCDHLEARMRSERKSGKLTTKKDVEALVDVVFDSLMDDDQFDDVSIPRLKIIRRLKQLLKTELFTKFEDHKRVDYSKATA